MHPLMDGMQEARAGRQLTQFTIASPYCCSWTMSPTPFSLSWSLVGVSAVGTPSAGARSIARAPILLMDSTMVLSLSLSAHRKPTMGSLSWRAPEAPRDGLRARASRGASRFAEVDLHERSTNNQPRLPLFSSERLSVFLFWRRFFGRYCNSSGLFLFSLRHQKRVPQNSCLLHVHPLMYKRSFSLVFVCKKIQRPAKDF